MREGVKKSVLSVRLSVCPVKNFEIRTFTRLKDCVRVHQPPRFQDCEKLGGDLGTRQRIRLGAQVSRVIKTRTLLRRGLSVASWGRSVTL